MGLTQKLGTIPLAIQTDSSNNVGIGGAANASYKLDVIGTTRVLTALTISSTTNAGLIAATNSTTGYTYLDLINNGASGRNYQIGVGGNAAASGYANNLYFDLVGVGNIMTLTSGRNVGIGTSSPALNLHIFTSGTSFTSSTITYSSATSRGILLDNSAGTSQSGNAIWFANSGLYSAISSTRVNTGNWGTDIRFYTHPDETTNQFDVTERMRLLSNGALVIGGTSAIGSWGNTLNAVSIYPGGGYNWFAGNFDNSSYVIYVQSLSTGGTRELIQFGTNTPTGSITTDGSTTSFNTNSDYRLKEDFRELKGLQKISDIKVYDFKWKNTENRIDGVIAHELAEVLPYAVVGEKDALDKDGEIKAQGVDYSKLVPVLIKAIQELSAKVTALENK